MSTYTFKVGDLKGETEKTIRLIFDKASRDANVTITKIEIRGLQDDKVKLNNI